jgi:hypothetical protein
LVETPPEDDFASESKVAGEVDSVHQKQIVQDFLDKVLSKDEVKSLHETIFGNKGGSRNKPDLLQNILTAKPVRDVLMTIDISRIKEYLHKTYLVTSNHTHSMEKGELIELLLKLGAESRKLVLHIRIYLILDSD